MESLKKLYNIGFGPSSSHTMGPFNACQHFLGLCPDAANYKVILYGSLALTGKGHLTDYIIKQAFNNKDIQIIFDYDSKTQHPNTLDIISYNQEGRVVLEKRYSSVGGGKILIKGEKENKDFLVYPLKTFTEIKKYCLYNQLSLPQFVYYYEGEEMREYLYHVFDTMIKSVENGMDKDGVLPGKLQVQRKAKQLSLNIDKENQKQQKISAYAYAVSEENASGNMIVTAPTCGAAGVLPAVLYYYYKDKNVPVDKIVDSLACAGIIGNVIKTNACISGAKAGCQSEIGSACSMTAAAVAYLENLNIDQIEYAAEIAMEHHLGLTCDPVYGLVQIPCIERNAVAALRAVDAAMLAKYLFGSRKISFDVVVKTMYETGKDLGKKYKETATGGLAKHYK